MNDGQVVEQFRDKQDPLLTVGSLRDSHVPVAGQPTEHGDHFRLGEPPRFAGIFLESLPQIFRGEQDLPARTLFLQSRRKVLDPLEGRRRCDGGLRVPVDLLPHPAERAG